MDGSYKLWKIKDKTLSNKINEYLIPNTLYRIAIYERSDYFNSRQPYSFRSILNEDPEFDLNHFLSFKRSASNVHRMASLVNCLANQESNLKSGLSVVECGAGPAQSSKYFKNVVKDGL